jgi:glyoxylase-like metal-dependent hydrolase (beta-lactamase superfamily II)
MAVSDFKTYYCGYCINNLHRAFFGVPSQEQQFPAAAVLFRHNGDCYLYDTGYSSRVLENGWRSKVYHLFNRIMVSDEDSLIYQLNKDGIRAPDIKGIILSHLHPDHIGGLPDFPGCKIIVSQGTYATLQKHSLLDLVFSRLLPSDLLSRLEVLDICGEHDLFGDGSVILKELSGHTQGQTGMYLPEFNTLFAADSCWSLNLLDKRAKFLGRFLQKDFEAYQRTVEEIRRMQEAGVKIIVSHEMQPQHLSNSVTKTCQRAQR